MGHEIRLCAEPPTVRSLVADWLSGGRLPLARPFDLKLVVGDVPPPSSSSQTALKQGRVLARTGSAKAIDLDWGPGLGHATVSPTEACVTVSVQGLEYENEFLRSFLLNVCILLVRHAGLHHVHGATLCDPAGRGWMLVGTSRSGKSTTTSFLGRNGWRVGTDDIAFLTKGALGETDVVAWRERLALRADAVALSGQTGGTPLGARGKTGWFSEELGADWVQTITPRVLLFPTPGPDRRTSVSPISGVEALSRFLPCSPWVTLDATLADEHLGLMSRLVTQARAFDVQLGPDLFDRPNLLTELVG